MISLNYFEKVIKIYFFINYQYMFQISENITEFDTGDLFESILKNIEDTQPELDYIENEFYTNHISETFANDIGASNVEKIITTYYINELFRIYGKNVNMSSYSYYGDSLIYNEHNLVSSDITLFEPEEDINKPAIIYDKRDSLTLEDIIKTCKDMEQYLQHYKVIYVNKSFMNNDFQNPLTTIYNVYSLKPLDTVLENFEELIYYCFITPDIIQLYHMITFDNVVDKLENMLANIIDEQEHEEDEQEEQQETEEQETEEQEEQQKEEQETEEEQQEMITNYDEEEEQEEEQEQITEDYEPIEID